MSKLKMNFVNIHFSTSYEVEIKKNNDETRLFICANPRISISADKYSLAQ